MINFSISPAATRSELPTWVYIAGSDSEILYVGIALSLSTRLELHRLTEWYVAVTRVDIELHPSRHAAAARERELIRAHRPVHNKIGGGGGILPEEVPERDERIASLYEKGFRIWEIADLLDISGTCVPAAIKRLRSAGRFTDRPRPPGRYLWNQVVRKWEKKEQA